MHKLTSFLAFTFILCSGCTSCLDPDGEDCESRYDFTIPVSIYPARDTFQVGDTIWVESRVPDVNKDNISGDSIDLSNLELRFIAGITDYSDASHVFADHRFDYVNQLGGFYLSQVIINVIYADTPNQGRAFKVGIIPKSKGSGILLLAFDFITHDYHRYELLNNNCLDHITFNFLTNEGRDSSRYLLLPANLTQTVTQQHFNTSGSFAFRVVD